MARKTEKQNVGTIEEITGVVIDAAFPDELPEIYSAIEVDIETQAAVDGEVNPEQRERLNG